MVGAAQTQKLKATLRRFEERKPFKVEAFNRWRRPTAWSKNANVTQPSVNRERFLHTQVSAARVQFVILHAWMWPLTAVYDSLVEYTWGIKKHDTIHIIHYV